MIESTPSRRAFVITTFASLVSGAGACHRDPPRPTPAANTTQPNTPAPPQENIMPVAPTPPMPPPTGGRMGAPPPTTDVDAGAIQPATPSGVRAALRPAVSAGVFASLGASSDAGIVLGNLTGDPIGDTIGNGGLGNTVTGTLGHGSGSGIGGRMGGSGAGTIVHPTPVSVVGRLSPEIVRRVVRRYIGQVAYCYERSSGSPHPLPNPVTVRFVIASNGSVASANTELPAGRSAPEGVTCLTQAVRRWMFPPPEAGVVTVAYEFAFTAG